RTLQTQSGDILGTPSYMPPEQACGRPASIGPPADVYALGAILYELITGRRPFEAGSTPELLLRVMAADPIPPSRLQHGIPRDLDTICLKCLQKDPRRRYARAADLGEDLERFREGRPILARPTSPLEKGWKWAKRNPVVTSLTTTLLLVLLVGAMLVT